MMKKLMNCMCTDKVADLAPLLLRLVLGTIFVVHGWQKLQAGLPMISGLLMKIGFPYPGTMAILLIAGELIGGVLIIAGAFTHWAGKLLAFIAILAFLTVHMSRGFFVEMGGYEYILLILAASLSLTITGAGKWSVDGFLQKKKGPHHGSTCGCGDCEHCHVGHTH